MGRGSEAPMGRNFLKMTMLSEVATLYYRAPDGILNVRTVRSNNQTTGYQPDSPRKRDTPIPSASVATNEQPIPRRASQGKAGPSLRTSGGNSPQGNNGMTLTDYSLVNIGTYQVGRNHKDFDVYCCCGFVGLWVHYGRVTVTQAYFSRKD